MMEVSLERTGKVKILDEGDIVDVRKIVRTVCKEIGFNDTDVTRVVTAASELARNVNRYAGVGEMHWSVQDRNGCTGLVLVFEDDGPGIADVAKAMSPGFSTVRGLGLGLPGTKRLMDEFEIRSALGEGTTVTVSKWLGRKAAVPLAGRRAFDAAGARSV